VLLKERIFAILVILSLGYMLYNVTSNNEQYIIDYNHKVKNLQTKVDSLYIKNSELAFEIGNLDIQTQKLDSIILQKDLKIKNLIYETNLKVDAVDSFDVIQLYEFFSKRYNP
jgi:hypothetical protein